MNRLNKTESAVFKLSKESLFRLFDDNPDFLTTRYEIGAGILYSSRSVGRTVGSLESSDYHSFTIGVS